MNVTCLRPWHRESSGTRSITRSQTLSGEESTWKGDPVGIPFVVDCFFFFITRFTFFGCLTSDVLFNQASVKIKFLTLWVYCYITFLMSSTEECLALLSTVFLTYLLEIREEA